MVAITVPISVDAIPLVKCAHAAAATVPSVDLSAPGAAAAVADACRGVGFFRATIHGVPATLTDTLEARAAAFFTLPHKDKLEASARPLGYGSKSIGCNGDVGWLEYILLSVGSGSVAAASLPPSLRAALEEYTDAVREVGARVLELMADGLGIAVDHRGVLRRMVASDEADEMVRVNHYPPCPCPLAAGQRGVMGFGEHTDPQIISVLRSNRTGGLQIMLPDGRWVPVAPDPDSLFVTVGDSLQVLTNGRFQSVKHRVVAPAEGQQSQLVPVKTESGLAPVKTEPGLAPVNAEFDDDDAALEWARQDSIALEKARREKEKEHQCAALRRFEERRRGREEGGVVVLCDSDDDDDVPPPVRQGDAEQGSSRGTRVKEEKADDDDGGDDFSHFLLL
ncbi:hypothetical protein CFC21_008943 [Triticum aestivum]|uniref:Fe2OG dioxygenase domain-containing protein n=3 Tax=Triticum aestivum TaxID=4565 RepID=A0A9R1ITC9_WHEAT|nr:hypothetical protein CFC21_008943 [Triticum aestivum]